MRVVYSAVLVTSLLVSGCVRQDRFRFAPLTSSCLGDASPTAPPNTPANQRSSLDCRYSSYRAAFLEFDEQGRAVDRAQEAAALRLLDRAKADAPGGKVITVVYIHGWKNNAAEAPLGAKPKDVEKFQGAMLELGYRAKKAADVAAAAAAFLQASGGPPMPIDAKKPVQVVGLYIGWRGKTLMGPDWYTFLSLWGRRGVANHIGDGPDLGPTLTRLIAKANGTSPNSRVLMIGHSFGARVLEHALASHAVALSEPTGDGHDRPLVDLVLFVNSANDARLSLQRLQEWQREPVTVRHPDFVSDAECQPLPTTTAPEVVARQAARCREYPLMVAITSTGDLATKYLLPIANTLVPDARPTMRHADGSVVTPAAAPSGDGFAARPPSSGTYKRSAAGHMSFLYSHATREVPCPRRPGASPGLSRTERQRRLELALHPVCRPGDASCEFVFRTVSDASTCFQVDRQAVVPKPPFNRTPFWIMAVEPTVIKDHGDIWNLSFVEMLGQLMAPRGFFEPRARRMQLQTAASPATAQEP